MPTIAAPRVSNRCYGHRDPILRTLVIMFSVAVSDCEGMSDAECVKFAWDDAGKFGIPYPEFMHCKGVARPSPDKAMVQFHGWAEDLLRVGLGKLNRWWGDVDAVLYDPLLQIVRIVWKSGTVHDYLGVPIQVWVTAKDATSARKWAAALDATYPSRDRWSMVGLSV